MHGQETHVRDQDAGFSVGVGSREGHGRVRDTVAVAADEHLRARRVEFRTTDIGGSMESDDLVTQEIASRRKVLGERQVVRVAIDCARG